jgi:hypothetical protein
MELKMIEPNEDNFGVPKPCGPGTRQAARMAFLSAIACVAIPSVSHAYDGEVKTNCFMRVNGQVVVDGKCSVDFNLDAKIVNFDTMGEYLSQLSVDGRSPSAWNGGSGFRVTTNIGVLRRGDPNCFYNDTVVVCADAFSKYLPIGDE